MASHVEEHVNALLYSKAPSHTRVSSKSWRSALRDRQLEIDDADREELNRKGLLSEESMDRDDPFYQTSVSLPDMMVEELQFTDLSRYSEFMSTQSEVCESADGEEQGSVSLDFSIISLKDHSIGDNDSFCMDTNALVDSRSVREDCIADLTEPKSEKLSHQPVAEGTVEQIVSPQSLEPSPFLSSSSHRKKTRRKPPRQVVNAQTLPDPASSSCETYEKSSSDSHEIVDIHKLLSPEMYMESESTRKDMDPCHSSSSDQGHVENYTCDRSNNADPQAGEAGPLLQFNRHSSYLKAISTDDSLYELSSCSESASVENIASTEKSDLRVDLRTKSGRKVSRRKSYRIATVYRPTVKQPSSLAITGDMNESCPIPEEAVKTTPEPLPAQVVTSPENNSFPGKSSNVAIREGQLGFKVTHFEGKRSSDRSWRSLYVVLRDCHLHLFSGKQTQENEVTESPVPVKNCLIEIAYNYSNKKNVFRLTTVKRSVFLFEASDINSQIEWVNAITSCASADDGDVAELVKHVPSEPRSSHLTSTTNKKMSDSSVKQKGSAGLPKVPSSLETIMQDTPLESQREANAEHSSEKKHQKEVKTWRTKLVNRFRQTSGPPSDSDDGAHRKGTFGVALDKCIPSKINEFVPLIVDVCIRIIEEKGLNSKGIYRVPGNRAAIASLQADVDKDPVGLKLDSNKWDDVNVVISLLKLFFRDLPESLITDALYPSFLAAIQDQSTQRLSKMKHLLHQLPRRNFETFRLIARHLSTVASMETTNMMDVRNLAIIFGPTLLQPKDINMVNMVRDMSAQCQIVECIVINHDWMFSPLDECDVVDGKLGDKNGIASVTGMDQILLERAENMATAKEEKDSDIRRLLRRVASRAKSSRKPRSKSAHSDLRMPIFTERNIDEEINNRTVRSAEQLKESDEELTPQNTVPKATVPKATATAFDKKKRSDSLSRLPVHHKESKVKTKDAVSSLQAKSQPLQNAEGFHFRSPTFRSRRVVVDRVQSCSTSPLITSQRVRLKDQGTLPPRGAQRANALRVPTSDQLAAHDFLMRNFNERFGIAPLPSPLLGEQSADGNPPANSVQSYTGSVRVTQTLTRDRPATFIGSYQQPLTTCQGQGSVHSINTTPVSSVLCPTTKTDQESSARVDSPAVLKIPDESTPATNVASESSSKQQQLEKSLPKTTGRTDSASSQDNDAFESFVIPIHHLATKRTWNVKTCSWQDSDAEESADELHNPTHCQWNSKLADSSNESLTVNSRQLVFCKAETAADSDILRPLVSFTEHPREHTRCISLPTPPMDSEMNEHSCKAANIEQENVCEEQRCTDTTNDAFGKIDDLESEPRVPLYRALSCPTVTSVPFGRDSSPERSYDHRNGTGMSSRRKRVVSGSWRRKQLTRCLSHGILPPTVQKSWPGKGDVVGSILAYESSV